MATTASPIAYEALSDRWRDASNVSLDFFIRLVHTQGDPF
jgi:hypothetical protein